MKWLSTFLFTSYPIINNPSSSCSCQFLFDCTYPAGIYNELDGFTTIREQGKLDSAHVPNFTMPGMFVGCFPFNTLLYSTLDCLYNITCLTLFQSYLPGRSVQSITPLSRNIESRFPLNTSVESMTNELMIERWEGTHNYSKFYQQCNPSICKYSFSARPSFIMILTTITGLFGGLSITLKVVAPIIIVLYRMAQRKAREIKGNGNSSVANSDSG